MRLRVTIGWALAVVVHAVPLAAQDAPAALATAYFADLEAERWEAAAGRLDPAALARWKAEVLDGLRRPPGFAVPTVESLMAANPDMSRTVAEHFATRVAPDPQRDVPIRFAGVESIEALERLEPVAAAARALEAAAPAHQLSIVRDRPPAPPPGGEGPDGGRRAKRRREVLGVVEEAPDLAHVVYLDRWIDPMSPEVPPDLADHKVNVRVATARLDEGGWALLPGPLLSRAGSFLVVIYGSWPPGEPRPEPEPLPAEPPMETAERFLGALDAERWDAAAAFFRASDLERWHREIVRRIETSSRRESVEEILAQEPDLPREVAEYRARQWPVDPMGQMYPPVVGVETLDELKALTPVAAAAGALQGGDPGGHPAQVLANHEDRMPPEDAAAYRAMTGHDASRTILGTVDGPTPRDVQVVYRLRWGGDAAYAIDEVEVLSLVATDEGWRARRTGTGLLGETSREPTWPVIILETIRPRRPADPSTPGSEVDRSDPEAVAAAFLQALNVEEWSRAVRLMDEVAVAWWHHVNVKRLERTMSRSDIRVPDIEEYRRVLLDEFAVSSVQEMRLLAPDDVAARHLEQIHRHRAAQQERLRALLATRSEEGEPRVEVLDLDRSLVGVVTGTGGFAYAVYSDQSVRSGSPHRPVRMLVLRSADGIWRVMPQFVLFGQLSPHPLDEMPPSLAPE